MGIFSKIKKLLFSKEYRFLFLSNIGFFNKMSDEKYICKRFKASNGYQLNLEQPKTFNEKLQWLKLYNRLDDYTKMVDKYLVRDYIKKTIGEEYLIPLIGVYEKPSEINFEKLPNQFVLKCNHNSGTGMFICKDKSLLTKKDYKTIIKNLNRGLKENYYLKGREWPYKNVERKIICEKYMSDGNSILNDYKVMCFGGKAKIVQTHIGRFTEKHYQDFYDLDWNHLDIIQVGGAKSEKPMPRPNNLEKMIALSETLSKDIPHLRVDWYSVDGHLYFGELTFFDGSGFDKFENVEVDELFGSWIKLPIKRENNHL